MSKESSMSEIKDEKAEKQIGQNVENEINIKCRDSIKIIVLRFIQ